jgi:hypothetical protein
MNNLIKRFEANPCDKTRAAILKHIVKHPMSEASLSLEQLKKLGEV